MIYFYRRINSLMNLNQSFRELATIDLLNEPDENFFQNQFILLTEQVEKRIKNKC